MHKIGQAYGLVWSSEGSSLIQIKTTIRKGSGKLAVNGDIGHDFLLSIEAAINLYHHLYKFDLDAFNITFHIPGPIDGPSAGLALFVSLHSAFTKSPINQRMAFTGAISERGEVLGVDEIDSKLMAAKRGNLESIVFPTANLPELPQKEWSPLILCPIINVTDAIVVSVPSPKPPTKLELCSI